MISESKNIFLVGLMGAGKTSVGRQLAVRLGKTFVDADHEIEARTGTSIPVIFEVEGEAGFRRREAEVIDELTQRTGIVLATGGGAVHDAATRARLKSRGMTIYLSANVIDLWHRTRNDRNRPLLDCADPKKRLEDLLALRDPLYREVADLVVETGRPSVNRLSATIVEMLVRKATEVADRAAGELHAAGPSR